MRNLALLLFLSLILLPCPAGAQAGSPDPDAPRPLDAHDTVFMEDMTWMEVRDALRSGVTIAILATGGVEQNGPYLATGKHNVILRATNEAIARKLGNALVAPIVPFVPEGGLDPPTGHMRYSGTISVREETFRELLRDVAQSLKAHGFETVILLGDSGGNQEGMAAVAEELSGAWAGSGTEVHYVPEYYDNPRWNAWLAERGVEEVDEGLHDDFRHSAIMALVDPTSIRMEERMRAGLFSINGVPLAPLEKTLALARGLVDYQAEVTVGAIRKALEGGSRR